jgi:opacity protein-like surface antigen
MGSFWARFGVAIFGAIACISVERAQAQQVHWEGLYIGTHAGYGRSDTRTSYTGNADVRALIAGGALPGSYNAGTGELTGGAQLGYNFRVGSLIFGAEGDFSAGSFSKTSSVTMISAGPISLPVDSVTYVDGNQWDSRASVKLDAISSLRGRIGLTSDNLMVYATAGVARADAKTGAHIAQSYPVGGPNWRNWTGGSSENVSGFVLGAGAEYAYSRHWLIRWEALRYDFGTVKDTLSPLPTNTGGGNFTPATRATNLDLTVVRAGLSYKF